MSDLFRDPSQGIDLGKDRREPVRIDLTKRPMADPGIDLTKRPVSALHPAPGASWATASGEADPDRTTLLDPATSAGSLQAIAARRADLHGLIAAHPNVYPALLEWIARAEATNRTAQGPTAPRTLAAAVRAQFPDGARLEFADRAQSGPGTSAVPPARTNSRNWKRGAFIGGLAAVIVLALVSVLSVSFLGQGGPSADRPDPVADRPSSGSAGAGAAVGASNGATPTPTPTPTQAGTFTFDCLDRICLGMTVDQFVSAFPQSRVWPWKTRDPSFGPGELFSQVVAVPGSTARSGRACTVIGDLAWEKAGTLIEVQFERGVVVAVVKIGDPAKRNQPAEFTTNGGLTGFSSLQSFRSEFGDVFVAADENGRGRWVLRGPNNRTMQIGRTAEGRAAAIGLMDGQHSMRFPSFHAEACGFMHNGPPDFS